MRVVGRLLERLQQTVGRGVAHRLGLLDHEDAAGRLERRAGGRGDHRLVDVGDEHLGGAARADPAEVGVGAAQGAIVGAGGIVGAVGEQGGGEGAGDGALAGPGRAAEEVGVRRASAGRQGGRQHRPGVRMVLEPGDGGHRCHVRGYRPGMPRGRLITIEGIDGTGKTTLAAGLLRSLADRIGAVELLREPGGVVASERIRDLVKDPAVVLCDRAEALLYAAARAQLVAERLIPLLEGGTWVVLDRFVDSSLAYQGAGRAIGIEAVRAINLFATMGLEADRTLLLRLDPAAARARAVARGEALDRLELEDEEFFARIAAGYDALARAEPKRLRVLDASRPADEVLAAAIAAIGDLTAVRVR